MPAARLALILASAAWVIGCAAATTLAPVPAWFWAALAVGFVVVAANLAAATARDSTTLARVAHVALALVAYAAVFPLAHALLGPGHFDAPPDAGAPHWTAFAVAHLLRAADALDLVQDWGGLQAVRHTSPEAAALLVGFHLVAGVFVIDAVGRGAANVRRRLVGELPRTMALVLLSTFAWLGVAACVAAPLGMILAAQAYPAGQFNWWLVPAFVVGAAACGALVRLAAKLRARHLGGAEGAFGELGDDARKPLARVGAVLLAPGAVVLLVALVSITGIVAKEVGAAGLGWWALDQTLRGADFADVMQLYGLRLHPGPGLPAAVVPAVVVRAVASVAAGVAVHALWRRVRS